MFCFLPDLVVETQSEGLQFQQQHISALDLYILIRGVKIGFLGASKKKKKIVLFYKYKAQIHIQHINRYTVYPWY